jgi:hypothetical protein
MWNLITIVSQHLLLLALNYEHHHHHSHWSDGCTSWPRTKRPSVLPLRSTWGRTRTRGWRDYLHQPRYRDGLGVDQTLDGFKVTYNGRASSSNVGGHTCSVSHLDDPHSRQGPARAPKMEGHDTGEARGPTLARDSCRSRTAERQRLARRPLRFRNSSIDLINVTAPRFPIGP